MIHPFSHDASCHQSTMHQGICFGVMAALSVPSPVCCPSYVQQASVVDFTDDKRDRGNNLCPVRVQEFHVTTV